MSKLNPFIRGCSELTITRLLMINYDEDHDHVYRKIHPTQEKHPDHFILGDKCWYDETHAYLQLTDSAQDDDLFDTKEAYEGVVVDVIYQLTSGTGNNLLHLGDYACRDDAQKVIDTISFNNGIFSRCWEISSAHLSEDSFNFLQQAAINRSLLPEFQSFQIDDVVIGVKLFSTPWVDDTVNDLRQEMVDASIPEALIDLVVLAGEADVRFLMFDGGANMLEGLPLYDR